MNVKLQPCVPKRLIGWVWELRAILPFCLVFLIPFFSAAEEIETPTETPYYVQTWTAEDGLPENRVVGVSQTSDGYLWVLTRGGLVRFDGVRFQPFEAASSAGFNTGTMWGSYLDQKDRLWVAKEYGALVCIAGANVLALTAKDGLPEFEEEKSMAEDSSGNLWISYSRGTVVRLAGDHAEDFTSKNGLPAGGICFFADDRNDHLWFAKNGQVGLLRGGSFVPLLNLSSHIIQIAPARSGGIWICAGQKVLKFNEGAKPVVLAELPNTRATAEPTALLEDSDGDVWVGTPDGLFCCDSNSVEGVKTSSPIISCLMEDREGGLWVGTQGGGLDRVQRRVVSLNGETSGLPFEGVRSVCRDASGALWAVGENWVLARQEGGQWVALTFDKNAPDNHATCVAADAKGTVWVGTVLGILYHWVNGQFRKLNLENDVGSGGLRSLFVTKSGDLWVAVDAFNANGYLYRIRGGIVKKFELPPGYRFVRAMTEDTSGNIWAGASDGLLVRVTGDTLIDETAKFPKYSIRCLYGASNGDLWIGYAGFGVGRLHGGKMTRFGASQGLPNDYVSQILADGKGGMWFAGNRGIFRVPEQDFDDVESGRMTQLQPVFYGRSQGLPNLQASFDFCPNALRDGDGRLYFSMLTGLAEVQTDRTRLNRLPPSVIIERVVADNRTFAAYQIAASQTETSPPLELDTGDKKREITLPPGFQHIQIKYTALSFIAPENVRFRYQMQGIDRNWVDAGTQRIAQYTRLPPGNYYFKVIACNNDGIWNNTGATVGITLEPYIWETLWFKILVGTGIIGVLCGSLVLILRRHHRFQIQHLEKQQALERERARIARDLHDDVGIGLTEIGLLGDLASAPTVSGNGETSRGYLHEITGRARELVVLLDEIVWAINPANDTSQSLSDYFLKFAQTLLHRASIRCRLEVVEPFPNCGLNAEERHQLFLAFKEALNNIIRHSGATEVQIGLGFVADELVIKVEDNGRGLNATPQEGSSDGLKGMQERLHRLGGRCEIAEVANGGTCVKLIIPARLPKNL
jgi:ligand-binding sensor domain-containing protein/signal transduction histidine kinase